jgi:hypothetical protein
VIATIDVADRRLLGFARDHERLLTTSGLTLKRRSCPSTSLGMTHDDDDT